MLEHLPAVELGQPDVENDDVGAQSVELAECGAPVDRLGYSEPCTLEHAVRKLTDVVGVLDEQDQLIPFPHGTDPTAPG